MAYQTKTLNIVNRKARHDFHILEKYEAGIVLVGCEIKSIRQGKVNLKDSYARISNHELLLENCHISPYTHGNRYNVEPTRVRKLLLHKKEISRLIGKIQEKGLTLIPLDMHFSGKHLKLTLGLCKAKKLFDKRSDLRERAIERDIHQSINQKYH